MAILMIQTAHNLFFYEVAIKDNTSIDVVIRTTTAAIFGYFISTNFHSGNKNISKSDHRNTRSSDIKSFSEIASIPKVEIKFNTDLRTQELDSGYAKNVTNKDSDPEDKGQIIVVATIGITCLIFLLIVRNYSTINVTSMATLSQLRDFVSGSVGFLIGHPSEHKK